jgi:hypothetical protein
VFIVAQLEHLENILKKIKIENLMKEVDKDSEQIVKFKNIKDKIKWVSENFEKVARSLKDVKRD